MSILGPLVSLIEHFTASFTNRITTKTIKKRGVEISKENYEIVKFMILDVLRRKKDITNLDLQRIIEQRLAHRYGKHTLWYYMVVREDLAARNIIQYIASLSPHRIRLS